MIRLSSIVFFLSIVLQSTAQKVVDIEGIASVMIDDDMSMNEAREKVRQAAMIDAIEKAFGVYVEQYTRMDMEEGAIHFKVIGETKVKGEWLKTTNELFTEDSRQVRIMELNRKNHSGFLGLRKSRNRERTEIWLTCEVQGIARMIEDPEIKYEFLTQKCLEPYCESTDFAPNDPFYLQFRTPVDGYLSVYIIQDNDRSYRVLPYQSMPKMYNHTIPVRSDMDYTFFVSDENHDYFENVSYMMVDELYMDTEKKEEYLDLYVLFSPNEFRKLNLKGEETMETDIILPRSSKKALFLDWLADNRIYDPDFSFEKTIIRIK